METHISSHFLFTNFYKFGKILRYTWMETQLVTRIAVSHVFAVIIPTKLSLDGWFQTQLNVRETILVIKTTNSLTKTLLPCVDHTFPFYVTIAFKENNPHWNPQYFLSRHPFILNLISPKSCFLRYQPHPSSICFHQKSQSGFFSHPSSSLSSLLIPSPIAPTSATIPPLSWPSLLGRAVRGSAASVRLTDYCNSYTLISCTNH